MDIENQTKCLNNTEKHMPGGSPEPPWFGMFNTLRNGRVMGVYTFIAVFVSVSLILRTVLLLHSFAVVDHSLLALIKVYAVGLFFDVVTSFFAVMPVVICLTFVPDRVLRLKAARYFAHAGFFVAVFLVLFDAVADWFFWEEFGNQFNFIVVDYMVYTREVIGNAMESYPVKTIICFISLLAMTVVFLTRKKLLTIEGPTLLRQRLKVGFLHILIPCLCLFFVRVSWSEISSNHYNNELAKNNVFSLVAAFFNNALDYNEFYITYENTETLEHLRSLIKSDDNQYNNYNVQDGISRVIASPGPELRKNVIVLVVESLSAHYLGIFGDQDHLTPNLDAIAKDGLLFRNLYATGTRTTRGLEAISMSIPPTPGRSVVKRPNNNNLFTIGQIFRQRGYETKFIYGGFGYFDNMNAFFSGNGFEIVDRANMSSNEKSFSNAWGVCDEDLFNRVLKESDKSFRSQRPFFSIIMTTSNHRPYTYPQKIDIPSGTGRSGAVKYTDYAIGQFVKSARDKPWFKDTVFVIVADHCAGSSGRVEIPVYRYHIPLIVYAPGLVQPGECNSLCSQIDVGPTLLGLLNFSYESRFFGKNILLSPPERALIGTYQKLGLLADSKLTILEPGKKAVEYSVGPNHFQRQTAIDNKLLFDTVAYYQTANYLLKKHLLSKL